MNFFVSPEEGGLFVKIYRPKHLRPKILISMFKKHKVVLLFKSGIVYDPFCKKRPYREERRWGKKRYKELMGLELPKRNSDRLNEIFGSMLSG